MRNRYRLLIAGLAAGFVGLSTGSGNIMSSEQRTAKLEAIAGLLSGEVRPLDEQALHHAPNPFAADLGVRVVAKTQTVSLSDAELLAELGKSIKPTGYFVFGGEPYLVFTEARARVGSQLSVMYKDKEYTITVTEISRLGYTIQYGDAELQQKLK